MQIKKLSSFFLIVFICIFEYFVVFLLKMFGKKEKKEKQFAVRLPTDLYEKLKELQRPSEFVRNVLYQALFGEIHEKHIDLKHFFFLTKKLASDPEYLNQFQETKEQSFWQEVFLKANSFLEHARGFPGLVVSYDNFTDFSYFFNILEEIQPEYASDLKQYASERGIYLEGVFRLSEFCRYLIQDDFDKFLKLLIPDFIKLFASFVLMSKEYFAVYKPWITEKSEKFEIIILAGSGHIYFYHSSSTKLASFFLQEFEFVLFYLLSFYYFVPAETPFRITFPLSLEICQNFIKVSRVEIFLPKEFLQELNNFLKFFFQKHFFSPLFTVTSAS